MTGPWTNRGPRMTSVLKPQTRETRMGLPEAHSLPEKARDARSRGRGTTRSRQEQRKGRHMVTPRTEEGAPHGRSEVPAARGDQMGRRTHRGVGSGGRRHLRVET